MSGTCFQTLHGSEYCMCRPDTRLLLIEVFTTWSTPSAKRVAYMNRLLQEFGGLGFRVVGLSLDLSPDEMLEAFEEEFHPDYPLLKAGPKQRRGESVLGDLNVVPMAVFLNSNCRVSSFIKGDVPFTALKDRTMELLK